MGTTIVTKVLIASCYWLEFFLDFLHFYSYLYLYIFLQNPSMQDNLLKVFDKYSKGDKSLDCYELTGAINEIFSNGRWRYFSILCININIVAMLTLTAKGVWVKFSLVGNHFMTYCKLCEQYSRRA